jgi:PEP-CTERM motif
MSVSKKLITITLLSLSTLNLAHAAPIDLVAGTVNMFRNTSGANNAGIASGDYFQYGADIVGGSAGTTLGAVYPATGFTDAQANCQPLATRPNFCTNGTPFSANQIAQPWSLRFQRAGAADVIVSGPSLAGTASPVPFPVNVTITGSGTTPTISWTNPGGFTTDAVRVNIYDLGTILPNGVAQQIHSTAVAANAGSYSIPAALSAGGSLHNGGNYVFNVQLIDTRGDPAAFLQSNNNGDVLRFSSSFFNFTPLSGGGPPQVFLPTAVNGVYNFAVQNVGPNSVTFIDPFVATGYNYTTGAGNPNFASVLLPTGIGDNMFNLFLWNGSDYVYSGIDLTGGTQYFFGGGGVSRFSIRGIEASAGLDPNNVSAFITGLTFVGAGDFTGTMTPLTVEVSSVPEPGTWAMLSLSLGAMGLVARRKKA